MRLSVQIEFDKTLDLKTSLSSVSVGRNAVNDLVIPHPSISRQHCRIEVIKGTFYITDLGSSNGTFVDGERIPPQKKTAFLTGQQLTLGKLECEVTESDETTPPGTETQKNQEHGNATSTIRLARIDLNRPAVSKEAAKKIRPKGPRNPVTDEIQNPSKPKKNNKNLLLLILIAAGAYLYFQYGT